ncbi:MAG: polyprenyl synthetase family protein [Candidatus Anstonellales archaeon]
MDLIAEIKEQVEKNIKDYIEKFETRKDIIDVIYEYISRDAKRIRPVIMILSAKAIDKQRLKIFEKTAIAIELFHNFTLIHDDIEDGSYYRRGKPTLHVLYGEPLAINFGDALFNVVWHSIIESGLTKNEMLLINKTFQEVVEGQHIEISAVHEERFDLAYEDYYEIASKKTGALIALCIALPFYKKSKKTFKKVYKSVKELGIAFQILDDVLNLTGDFEKYKKKIGDDITEGKRTLMVIYTMKNSKDKDELKAILSSHTKDEEKIKRAIQIIKESGAIEFAKNKAKELVDKNLPILKQAFPDCEEKEALMSIVNMFINREK